MIQKRKLGGNLFNNKQVQILKESKCICIAVIARQVGEKHKPIELENQSINIGKVGRKKYGGSSNENEAQEHVFFISLTTKFLRTPVLSKMCRRLLL